MDRGTLGLAMLFLPQTPFLLKTALYNALSWSPNSSKQDMRTEVVVAVIRHLTKQLAPLGKMQKGSMKDPGMNGPMWISKATLPRPEDVEGPREALARAIKELGDGQEEYTIPEVIDVEGEWTGYRSDVKKNSPQPKISEDEKYEHLMAEVSSDLTILYFHGGAFFLMDPASHRLHCSRMAKLTNGRCFSVRYRLAPQSPFPAAILDGLIAYLSLLSPPPGAIHKSVLPGNIVFAGDSAGGNLSLVLLLTLLTLRRIGVKTIRFHGQDVEVALPAGVAVNSAWCDITRSMPSISHNARFDYLSAPSPTRSVSLPPDDIWPTKPPRGDIYCNASMLTHPLASPLAAKPELWKGAPPVYLCTGNEGLEDEICVVARNLYRAGATVVFDGYEGMPHAFAMIIPQSTAGRQCYKSWTTFCNDAIHGTIEKRDTGTWMKSFTNPPQFDEVKLEEVTSLSDDVVDKLLLEQKEAAVKREAELLRRWREGQSQPKL